MTFPKRVARNALNSLSKVFDTFCYVMHLAIFHSNIWIQSNKLVRAACVRCHETKCPLLTAEGVACADPGARTPIGASGNFPNQYAPFLSLSKEKDILIK